MLLQIKEIVTKAGEQMLGYQVPKVFVKEGHANFVTEADIAVQSYLMEALGKLYPDASFFAEEKEDNVLTDEPTFFIDPIDGTTNFIRGRQCSAISVALAQNKETVLAVVYNPYSREMFWAEKGKGAFCNGVPIEVSTVPFEQAIVYVGTSPYQPELARRTMDIGAQFLLRAGDIRRLGSAALDLCDVARGRCEVYFELVLSPWDYAAGMLILTEAGGMVCSPGKGPLLLDHKMGILAASPLCFAAAEQIIVRG